MLHLVGSLKSLANDYLKDRDDGLEMDKGYFPHLFNKAENYGYVGDIPDRKYFDLAFVINDENGYNDFNTWYESQKGKVWNFQTELEKYCINDVECLAEIVKSHHEICIDLLKDYDEDLAISPWSKTTAAGYVHMLSVKDQTKRMGIHDKMTVDEIENLANDNWAVLTNVEYYFARSALRGGRTEIRKFYHNGIVKDLDIQSEYPYCQMAKQMEICGEKIDVLYPVGAPTIEVFDPKYFPCNYCGFNPEKICDCKLERKRNVVNLRWKVKEMMELNSDEMKNYINNFFGFIMVDVQPPKKLYHPVLPTFDREQKKCVFGLEKIEKTCFCSVELQLAMKKGYVVTKIYRADRYKAAPSKWRGLLGVLYKLKMYNSGKAPENIEDRERIKNFYKNEFDMDITFDRWGKRPAAKKTAKILCNSGWGKHAETMDPGKNLIVNESLQMRDQTLAFYESLQSKTKILKQFNTVGENMMFRYTDVRSNKNSKPFLHTKYVPCAVFVPMYGRLMLYNHLDKLGERVLMCDTDSIKYTFEEGGYDIKQGDCLGDWEDEGDSCEFVALCPKSYGQKGMDGKSWFKCKGVNLKRSHGDIFNFDVAKKVLMEGKQIVVPQMTFDYTLGSGMRTRHYEKLIKFDAGILKGDYNPENYQLYPFGY